MDMDQVKSKFHRLSDQLHVFKLTLSKVSIKQIETFVHVNLNSTKFPVFGIFSSDGQFLSNLMNVTKYPQLLKTNNVTLEYNTKTYELGKYGGFLIDTINQSSQFQSHMTCYEFAEDILSMKEKDPTCTWTFSPDNTTKLEKLKPHTSVCLTSNLTFKHAAFHVEDGIFLSKIGPSLNYMICDIEQLRVMYPFDTIHPIYPARFCGYCGTDPKKLYTCTGCRKITYCDKHCQINDRPNHKGRCGPKLDVVPRLLSPSSKDVSQIFKQHRLEPRTIDWITNMINTCNEILTPCTELEMLNELMETNDGTLINLDVSNEATTSHDFSVIRLHQRALNFVYTLLENRVLGFQVHTPATWTGISQCPPIPTDLKFKNKKYQAPFKITHGPTKDNGHFFKDIDGEYRFYWNDR